MMKRLVLFHIIQTYIPTGTVTELADRNYCRYAGKYLLDVFLAGSARLSCEGVSYHHFSPHTDNYE